jgi:hypothetical protein
MSNVRRNPSQPIEGRRRRGERHLPRVAGDGRVLLPDAVSYAAGIYAGDLSGVTRDPFGWTADRLLLTESFARLNLFDPAASTRWFESHGMVDAYWIEHAITLDVGRLGPLPGMRPRVADDATSIGLEQHAVKWHLDLLTLLSENRQRRKWKPEWGRAVLDQAANGLIIGGPFAGRSVSSMLTWETDREQLPNDPTQRAAYEEQLVLHEATEGWPRIILLDSLWRDTRPPAPDGRDFSVVAEARRRADVLGTTWEETVELLRLTIEPRMQRAIESRFTTQIVDRPIEAINRRVLEPVESRTWRSILHPIYAQLFEALRRITEGKPGATVCRECGRTFLVLDERRSLFCNDRERYRYAQRQRRERARNSDVGEVPT